LLSRSEAGGKGVEGGIYISQGKKNEKQP